MNRRISILFGASLLLFFAKAETAASRTWYVKVDGTGDVPTLQAAIDTAAAGDTVLAAPGHYKWSNQGAGDERGWLRFMRGTERFTFRSEVGPDVTILDAEYQSRVIYLQGMNYMKIEGFTVTRGQATDFGDMFGGGLFCHIASDTIRDCIFTANRGRIDAGLHCSGGGSSILVERCTFIGNDATRFGGGLGFTGSELCSTVRDCFVKLNYAAERGGGIFSYANPVIIENCVIVENQADIAGGGYCGGMVYGGSSMSNCTICRNRAPEGGGINVYLEGTISFQKNIIAFNHGGALSIDPPAEVTIGCCVIYGNSGSDTIPEGAIDTGFNIFLDPQFCGVKGSDNYYLQSDSPCLPINHPGGLFCGLIGARPAACGTVGAKQRSWSGIKKPLGR